MPTIRTGSGAAKRSSLDTDSLKTTSLNDHLRFDAGDAVD